jgi:hypothetical protein
LQAPFKVVFQLMPAALAAPLSVCLPHRPLLLFLLQVAELVRSSSHVEALS